MDMVFTVIGALGSIFCVSMYFMLERGYAKSSDLFYYALNGLGGFMVLIACLYDFDGGDLGAVAQELCWVSISVMGIIKFHRAKGKSA